VKVRLLWSTTESTTTFKLNNTEVIEKNIQEIGKAIALENELNHYINSYSNRMKYKLLIICALIIQPYLLLLDEPFTELDPVTNYKLVDLFKSTKINTILFSTHTADIAYNYGTTLLYLQKNGVCENKISDFKSANELNSYITKKMKDDLSKEDR
jgi:ABC-type multidrug transport system ATPase subunit